MKRIVSAFGFTLLMAAASFAQTPPSVVAGSTDAVTLKRNSKVGDTAKFKITGHMQVGGGEAEYAASMSIKVTKFDPSGAYSTETATSDVKVTFGGQEMPMADTPPQTTDYDANGVPLKISGGTTAPDADEYRFESLNSFSFPDHAVKVGDTWTATRKADPKTGASESTVTYTVLAREKVDAYDTLKIKASSKEKGSDGASIEGTVWMDVASGGLVKSESTWTNVPVTGAPGPVNGKITVVRVS